jgi:hypothetical protein
LNKESLLEAIFASTVSCTPDSDDNNSFPGVVSVYKTKHGLGRANKISAWQSIKIELNISKINRG